MKTLVAYFSAEFGKTAELAKAFAEAAGADLFEIVPEEPYTKKDLRYTNPLARCNVEKIRKKDVPVAGKVYAFATSGGSGIGKTAEKLKPYVKGASVIKAKLTQTVDQLKSWEKELL